MSDGLGSAAVTTIARPPHTTEIDRDWRAARDRADGCAFPEETRGLRWLVASVPGTAAGALRAAGELRGDEDLDAEDWWFATRFTAVPAAGDERLVLVLEGVATVAEIFLGGELLGRTETMFAGHEFDVTDRVAENNELVICCRALGPRLAVPRRPRARWRTAVVRERNLRFFRTTLLGRAPGFAPSPAVVGPFRPVRLERRRATTVTGLRLRPRLNGRRGELTVTGRVEGPAPQQLRLELTGGRDRYGVTLELGADGRVSGRLEIEQAVLWWPHTHGNPSLYQACLVLEDEAGEHRVSAGAVGFRELVNTDPAGVALAINGVPVFARGAVWTPLDLAAPHSEPAELRAALERLAAAGLNMVRLPGTGVYESDAFYGLCDELGLLVWHDFAFANFDYPDTDGDFCAAVREEARQLLARIGQRPCLAVLCGGSEVAQQAAMMGVDPNTLPGPLFEELLPTAIAEAEIEVPYVPSAPWGGDLPFRTDVGVANYFGVGGYRRPLDDARRAQVRFASECLAFANVPDDEALAGLGLFDSDWKAGVPRDVGAGWDFDDVRDHYLRELYGVDPVALRSVEPAHYLELSRQLTGEVMAEVMGEWRRGGSTCAGALVLWAKDLLPGAGWGLLDHRGHPKVALHHLSRVLAPVAVWSTGEGLGGVVAHLANDTLQTIDVTLRVTLYRDRELETAQASRELTLPAHSVQSHNVEALLGRFVDAAWAYRFGPPGHDLIVLSLLSDGELISQAFHHPVGRPLAREALAAVGLDARLEHHGERVFVHLSARRLLWGVRVSVPGYAAEDDAFSIEPGHERRLELVRCGPQSVTPAPGRVTALNLSGTYRLAPADQR